MFSKVIWGTDTVQNRAGKPNVQNIAKFVIYLTSGQKLKGVSSVKDVFVSLINITKVTFLAYSLKRNSSYPGRPSFYVK